MSQPSGEAVIRVAAAGDLHCRESRRDEIADAFADVSERADLIVLAGDLTTHGEPEQAAILADACRPLDLPVFTVLGNHDWHANRAREITEVLEDAGVRVLERDAAVVEVAGRDVGVVGLKGFVGGFPGSFLPDFGEPLLREVYAEATRDVDALDAGLREVSWCALRIVVLHYAPTHETIVGEPEGIWAFLGNERMAAPILEHEPHLVVHGHAHAGTFEGAIGKVPVYNVSVPVLGRDFCVFELTGAGEATSALH